LKREFRGVNEYPENEVYQNVRITNQ